VARRIARQARSTDEGLVFSLEAMLRCGSPGRAASSAVIASGSLVMDLAVLAVCLRELVKHSQGGRFQVWRLDPAEHTPGAGKRGRGAAHSNTLPLTRGGGSEASQSELK
jgi:hypothetical protein